MSRVQLALNVDDIEEAVAFYSRLPQPPGRRSADARGGGGCEVWVTGPGGERREVCTVLADAPDARGEVTAMDDCCDNSCCTSESSSCC